ncbi:putative protein-disulfide isomerase [Oceanospirillum multiglobuliferum]|uniref:DSBA-like thioredoxin domain-containing protein n=1 Tax=Oceanospirillum multiglobuliferum TaxID=64969 RepID=A0A1T4NPW2_9GAMM|nr:hypothetical protein [Oceanospirillum multiglobuliferum]OPX55717.1 hypothetical protein BTE48_07435 [Oceanospirillum multiglobuliferum]SJZ81361.1 putative protein-disulfide isomerase [Oceanospirillum multiglobuliferum]
MAQVQIAYIMDPLCGWCYAAAPIIDQMRNAFGDQIQWQVYVGGLMPESRVLGPRFREHILSACQRIEQLTGQPFGDGFKALIQQPDSALDSRPAALAIRELILQGDMNKTLDLIKRLQHQHYVEGFTLTEPEVLLGAAEGLLDDPQSLAALLAQPENWSAETESLFFQGHNMLTAAEGQGYPTLAIKYRGRYQKLPHEQFYQQPEQLIAQLTPLVAEICAD